MFCFLFTLIRSAWLNCSALCNFPYVLNIQWTFSMMRFLWISLATLWVLKDRRVESANRLVFWGVLLKKSLDYIHDYLAYPARIPNYWLPGYKSEEITKQHINLERIKAWTCRHEYSVNGHTVFVFEDMCTNCTFFFLALLISNCRNCHWWLLFKVLNFFYFFIGFPFKSTNDSIMANNP